MTSLLSFLNSVFPLSNELTSALSEIIQTKQFAKHDLILTKGKICKEIYFIERGFVRSWYKHENKEVTGWFMGENDVIISVKSFFLQEKSDENIEALEETIVHFIDYAQLELLYMNYLEFNVTGRKLLTHYYILSEKRSQDLRSVPALERYQILIKVFPQIFLRTSSKSIASYLGITTETLSRMRKLDQKKLKKSLR